MLLEDRLKTPIILDMDTDDGVTYHYKPKDALHRDKIKKSKFWQNLTLAALINIAAFGSYFSRRAEAAEINVPGDYPTIQLAIDAASSSGDTINIADGSYNERLNINQKSIDFIGSGTNNCVIYCDDPTNTQNIKITGPCTNTFSGIHVNGGDEVIPDFFSESSARGVVIITDATCTFIDTLWNRFVGRTVQAYNSEVTISNLTVDVHNGFFVTPMDFVLEFNNCRKVDIYGFKEETGQYDHVMSMRNSDFVVKNSIIYTCNRKTGDGISIGGGNGIITNCVFDRKPGGDAPDFSNPAAHHAAVSIFGIPVFGTSSVVVADCTVSNVPQGVYLYASSSEHLINAKIQKNLFDCTHMAVMVEGLENDKVDLGGGYLGSPGLNDFVSTSTNSPYYDIMLTNAIVSINAYSNTWTFANPRDGIHDQKKDPLLGLVNIDYTINGIPWQWLISYGITNTSDSVETENPDTDFHNNLEEYIADTIPTNGNSYFPLLFIREEELYIPVTSTNRLYSIYSTTNLLDISDWSFDTNSLGVVGELVFTINDPAPKKFYRSRVELPDKH